MNYTQDEVYEQAWLEEYLQYESKLANDSYERLKPQLEYSEETVALLLANLKLKKTENKET